MEKMRRSAVAARASGPRDMNSVMFGKLAAVNVWTQLSNILAAVAEGILIGRFLGASAIGSFGLVQQCFSIMTAVIAMAGIGAQVLYSSALGKNDTKRANAIFNTSVLAISAISVSATVLSMVFADGISRALGARGDAAGLLRGTSAYLRGLVSGNLFFCLASVMSPAIQLDGGARTVKAAGVAGCAVRVLGDLLCVFALHSGVGAFGITASVSYLVTAAVMLLHFARGNRIFSLDFRCFSFRHLKGILLNGFSAFTENFMLFATNVFLYAFFSAKLGLDGITALSVSSNVIFFLGAFVNAVSQTVMTFVSLHYGEKDGAGIVGAVANALKFIGLVTVPLSVLVFALSGEIASLYMSSGESRAAFLARLVMSGYAVALPFESFCSAYVRIQQSVGRKALSSVFSAVRPVVAFVASCHVLALFPQDAAICFCYAFGYFSVFAITVSIMVLHRLKHGFGYGGFPGMMVMVRRDFLIPDDHVFRCSVSDAGEAASESERMGVFCIGCGVPRDSAMKISLAFEEISVFVLNGASGRGGNAVVEAKLFVTDGAAVLRIRDNCPEADLKARALNWKAGEEGDDGIGLNMALRLASDFSYFHTLSVNNEIIRFNLV